MIHSIVYQKENRAKERIPLFGEKLHSWRRGVLATCVCSECHTDHRHCFGTHGTHHAFFGWRLCEQNWQLGGWHPTQRPLVTGYTTCHTNSRRSVYSSWLVLLLLLWEQLCNEKNNPDDVINVLRIILACVRGIKFLRETLGHKLGLWSLNNTNVLGARWGGLFPATSGTLWLLTWSFP